MFLGLSLGLGLGSGGGPGTPAGTLRTVTTRNLTPAMKWTSTADSFDYYIYLVEPTAWIDLEWTNGYIDSGLDLPVWAAPSAAMTIKCSIRPADGGSPVAGVFDSGATKSIPAGAKAVSRHTGPFAAGAYIVRGYRTCADGLVYHYHKRLALGDRIDSTSPTDQVMSGTAITDSGDNFSDGTSTYLLSYGPTDGRGYGTAPNVIIYGDSRQAWNSGGEAPSTHGGFGEIAYTLDNQIAWKICGAGGWTIMKALEESTRSLADWNGAASEQQVILALGANDYFASRTVEQVLGDLDDFAALFSDTTIWNVTISPVDASKTGWDSEADAPRIAVNTALREKDHYLDIAYVAEGGLDTGDWVTDDWTIYDGVHETSAFWAAVASSYIDIVNAVETMVNPGTPPLKHQGS